MPDEPASGAPASDGGELTLALSELISCETLAQTTAWAARWSAAISGANGSLVWTPDAVQPAFTCTAALGEGLSKTLRRTVPRGSGTVRNLVRDRIPLAFSGSELLFSTDAWLSTAKGFEFCLALPLQAEGTVVALISLLFREEPENPDDSVAALETFAGEAGSALARALKTDRKTSGMLHAIERLTNLYDLSKAFGSTIDWSELTAIIARKAVDFSNGEIASLWIFEGEEAEVALAATAINESYDVENAPEAVGSSIVADLLAEHAEIAENGLPGDHPLSQENPSYPIRSVLAITLLEEDEPVGALVVANKRGRHPDFSDVDRELLTDLGHQAVRALRNARRYEAEKKVEELDALLAVSREITATLDLDRVMKTIVNATSALIPYERCAISILQRGKMQLGAVAGVEEINRSDPGIRRTGQLLEWVYFGGSDAAVSQDENGEIIADRPETREKFRVFFQESEMRSFYGLILQDEEGKLGVLGFESREPFPFDQNTRDLLQILVNQATVALRNAQLYQQVPLMGFWKPFLEKRRNLAKIPGSRRRMWAYVALATALSLAVIPWNVRVEGRARIAPGRRIPVTPAVDGVVSAVLHREGDFVSAGEPLATLADDRYRASLAEARAAFDIAESDVAKFQAAGDAASTAAAVARREEARARIGVAEEDFSRTQIRAPAAGVLVTPHLEDRVGQFLSRGSEFAVLSDLSNPTAEVAVPETEINLLRTDERVALKLNSYPARTFRGAISRIGAEVRQDGEERFLVVECRLDRTSPLIRSGMLGKAKISTGLRPLGVAIFRKPVRYVWFRLWPILP